VFDETGGSTVHVLRAVFSLKVDVSPIPELSLLELVISSSVDSSVVAETTADTVLDVPAAEEVSSIAADETAIEVANPIEDVCAKFDRLLSTLRACVVIGDDV